jgi:hypothetical protein
MSQKGSRDHYEQYIPGTVQRDDDASSPGLRELAAVVSQNTDLLNTMNAQIQQLIEDNRKKDDDLYKSQQEQLNNMTKQLAETQAELALVKGKLDLVKTCSSTMQAILQPPTMMTTTASRNVRQRVGGSYSSVPTQRESDTQQDNSQPSDMKPSCKGKRISQLLVDFYHENRLAETHWKNVQVHSHYPEGNLVRKSLELCQYVMSAGELVLFQSKSLTEEDELQTVAKDIELRAFRKMWEFEGISEIDEKFATNKRLGSRGQQPTYGALGARVREYKKYLAKFSGSQIPDKEPLAERPQEEDEDGSAW